MGGGLGSITGHRAGDTPALQTGTNTQFPRGLAPRSHGDSPGSRTRAPHPLALHRDGEGHGQREAVGDPGPQQATSKLDWRLPPSTARPGLS